MSALGLSAADTKLSRDDRRKKKEVEEARMAGTLPPEVDNDGNLINPHIPEYMSKAPWYLNQEMGAGLKHQKAVVTHHFDSLKAQQQKGFVGRAKKYRKGACQNCGAMTHKTKECVYRPRKVGAWKTNEDIQPDEILPQKLALTYDGKRDRWNGYNPEAHKQTIERFEFLRKERRRRKIAQKDKKFAEAAAAAADGKKPAPKNLSTYHKLVTELEAEKKEKAGGATAAADDLDDDSDTDTDTDIDSDSDTDSDVDSDDEDEVRQHDTQEELVGQKMMRIGTGSKHSVRNLRIREDLPKYLRNLDVNSAFFAPKTRSMRENPTPNAGNDTVYMGDNWVRVSGDSVKMAQTQIHAWEAYRQGTDINMAADPTTVALMEKQTKERREQLKRKQKDDLVSKYDPDRKHMAKPDKSLLLGETEQYQLFRPDGTLAKGAAAGAGAGVVAKSKYEEDVYPLNHTSVFGSWFNREAMTWGFQCCYQCSATAYCTGEAGRKAHVQGQVSKRKALDDLAAKNQAKQEEADAAALAAAATGTGGTAGEGETQSTLVTAGSELYGEAAKDVQLDEEKLAVAMAKAKAKAKKAAKKEQQRKEQKRGGGGGGGGGDGSDSDSDGGSGGGSGARGKRKYNSMAEQTVSAEDMEAWRATRTRADDPMAKFNAEADGGVAGDSDDDLMAADKAHKAAMEEVARKKAAAEVEEEDEAKKKRTKTKHQHKKTKKKKHKHKSSKHKSRKKTKKKKTKKKTTKRSSSSSGSGSGSSSSDSGSSSGSD